MKKSKLVSLVLITSALASCNKSNKETGKKSNVYMRSDTTANYSRSQHHHGNSGLMWFYAFRPYGHFSSTDGSYHRSGFYSSGISEKSNVGFNSSKHNTIRGGFGRSGFSVSS